MNQFILSFLLFICFPTFNVRGESPTMLKIGTMDLPPYGWEDKRGIKHGIIFEMNEEIGKRSKVSFENKIYPFKRMLKLLKSGKIDIISSQAHNDSMSSGDKLAVQFDIDVIAGTRKGSNLSSISSLKGKHLVYHRSASYKELKGLPKKITRVESYRQALGVLVKNREADAAVFSEPAYYYWMKDLGLTPSDFGNVILIEANKKQWIFVRRDFPLKLKAKLKIIVEEIYQEKVYQKLLIKYGKK